MYTIKKLFDFHRPKVQEHFIRLDSDSRHSRFCAVMHDDNIISYVKKIDFTQNGIYGIFNDNLDIIGVGECVFHLTDKLKNAEVVEKPYQNKGLGNLLMKKIVQFANVNNLKELTMYFLYDNSATKHLAKKYNFKAEYSSSEISGTIQIPKNPKIIDGLNQHIEEFISQVELTQKWQNKLLNEQIDNIYKNIHDCLTPLN
jgi:GNAT superfamily N-acetyltransferase